LRLWLGDKTDTSEGDHASIPEEKLLANFPQKLRLASGAVENLIDE
jgi:hypothetical protein